MKKLWGLKIFIVFLFCIITHNVFSKENKDLLQSFSRKEGGANTLYIENKGQIGDQNGKPNPSVKYLILRPGLNIQLKANSFSYDAYTIERFKRVERLEEPLPHKFDKQNDDSLVYHFSRVDIELVDANPNPQITHEGASSDYLNYYTHITSQTKGEEGATGVRGYSTITYYDIYPKIDLEWFLDKDGKPEYQFIINPGGDPSRIRLKYHGAKKTELISDAIHIHIKPGIIKEHIPLSYLKESKEKLQIVFTKVANNEYGFNIPTYASNETLVIDPMPNRLWGTYYGGSTDESISSLSTDVSGNVYLGGITNSTTDIASTGAWDVTYGGNNDAFLAKFSSSGPRLWGTYYGGSGNDVGRQVVLDASGNVFLGGSTESTTDIASTGAYDVTYGGNNDAFLAKFSSSGSRLWGTYYGGSGWEGGTGVALSIDATGNVYLSSSTQSTTDIASTGAWDVTLGGPQDAFLVKFSSNGSRVWGTYYGGLEWETLYAISTDASQNIYITGSTSSTTDIASTGAYDVTLGGTTDAFLAKFSSSGSIIWGTYYGGSGEDWLTSITKDASGNIYLGGNTFSTTDIASTGAHDVTLGGGRDAFLAKFSSSGSRIWGTYYGGSGYDQGREVATDASGNIYLGGITSSTTDIASTGAYDVTLGGTSDAFLAKFSSSGSRIWGTYYGGNSGDYGQGLATDASGNVYLGGETNSTADIASTGAYDVTLGGPNDAFLVKFEEGFLTQISSPTSPISTFCQNQSFSLSYTITGTFTTPNTFTAQLSDANGSFTNPTPIGSVSSTTSGSINCRIPRSMSAGTGYRIRIISSNPSIIGSDNGTNIVINALPQPIISGSTSACEGSLTYAYTVPSVLGHTYLWTSPSKGIIIGSTTGNSVSIRWTIAGVDSVKIRQTNSQTGCFKDTTIIVQIQTLPIPVITGSTSVCQQSQNNSYSVVNTPGHVYQWYAPTRGVITGSGTTNAITVHWTTSGTDSVKIRQTNPQTGCFKDTTLIITIQSLPSPSITGSNKVCLSNATYTYSVSNVSGMMYQWFAPSRGIITGSGTGNSVQVQWTTTGIDSVKVRLTNSQTGCFKDTTLIVSINPSPLSVISGANKPCLLNKAVRYSVSLQSGISYQWISPSRGSIVGSDRNNTVDIVWTAPGVDSVRLRTTNTSTGCFSDTSFIVTINPSPSISGERALCVSPTTVEYSVKSGATSQYSWRQPKLGMIVGLSDANTVKIRWNTTGSDTLFVRETNITSGCSKDTFIVVTILPQPQPTISGNPEVLEQEKGLVYSVQLENGSSYEWSIVSGDATITTKSGQLVVVNVGAKGSVILKVVQTNKDGCINEAQFVITVKSPSGITGEAQSLFSIYPNPTGESNHILIDFTETLHQDISIELLDILGSVHYSNIIQSGSESCTIPIQGLSSGMYVIRLRMDNQVFIEKLIVN